MDSIQCAVMTTDGALGKLIIDPEEPANSAYRHIAHVDGGWPPATVRYRGSVWYVYFTHENTAEYIVESGDGIFTMSFPVAASSGLQVAGVPGVCVGSSLGPLDGVIVMGCIANDSGARIARFVHDEQTGTWSSFNDGNDRGVSGASVSAMPGNPDQWLVCAGDGSINTFFGPPASLTEVMPSGTASGAPSVLTSPDFETIYMFWRKWDSGDNLVYATSPRALSFGDPNQVPAVPNIASDPAVAFDPQGDPVALYTDTAGALWIASLDGRTQEVGTGSPDFPLPPLVGKPSVIV
jgi:hypothetical protein